MDRWLVLVPYKEKVTSDVIMLMFVSIIVHTMDWLICPPAPPPPHPPNYCSQMPFWIGLKYESGGEGPCLIYALIYGLLFESRTFFVTLP